jgi:multicomponent Na+:H+ antiporter subunit D
MIFGISMANAAGFAATVYYITHHIIVQTTLFLAVGLLERQGGTTSLSGLGGMMRTAPTIAVLFFIPMLNLGGIPPFSGFIGKLGLFTVAAELATPGAYWLMGIGALVSLLTLYALARAWVLAFWRPRSRKSAIGEQELSVVSDTGSIQVASGANAPIATTEALRLWRREKDLFERLHDAPDALPQQKRKRIPSLMVGATLGMVLVSIALTVFAGPLYDYAWKAGQDLAQPEKTIERVLGNSNDGLGGGSGKTGLFEPEEDDR